MIKALREPISHFFGPRCSNKSLMFHRLSPDMDQNDETDKKTGQKDKDNMLDAMCQGYFPDTLDLYNKSLDRWKNLDEHIPDLELFEATLSSRLICGMGNKGVQECGATFLLPWGVPYIPGSAVKGVASTYAHAEGGEDWCKSQASPFRSGGKKALLLFGGNETPKKSFSGAVDFMDAWWLPDGHGTPFEKDILTPHNKRYLGQDIPEFPDGTYNPIPVKLLVIKAGQRFLFGVRGPEALRNTAKTIIRAALEAQGPGLGAKTRLGYGRFDCKKSGREIDSEKFQRSTAALEEFYQQLRDGTLDYNAAKKYVSAKKLAEGVDKSCDIVRKIYAVVLERWPSKECEEGWHTKFGPA